MEFRCTQCNKEYANRKVYHLFLLAEVNICTLLNYWCNRWVTFVSFTYHLCFFTVRKRSCGKVMFLQACVKNSVLGGQVYTPLGKHPLLGRHPPGRHPPGRHPPGQTPFSGHPPMQAPPGRQAPLGRHPPPPTSRRLLQRTVRILLECILVQIYIH